MAELAIRVGHEMTVTTCAVCGAKTETNEGPDLFTSDTWEPVCWTCGRETAPQLVALLMLGVSAESYAMAMLGGDMDEDAEGEEAEN